MDALFLLLLLEVDMPFLLLLFFLYFIVGLVITSYTKATNTDLLPAPVPLKFPGICGPCPWFSLETGARHGQPRTSTTGGSPAAADRDGGGVGRRKDDNRTMMRENR